MGCGSSRDPLVSLDDETEEKPDLSEEEILNEEVDECSQEITPEQTLKHEIPLTPVKQNGTSILEPLKPRHIEDLTQRPDSNSSSKSKRGETAVAFEVVVDESLIRKHPPKKFQRLEDIQTEVQLTPEELEMKQEIARKRRQNLLNKRVQSAKERSAKSAHIRSTSDENHEDDGSVIESPEDM